MVADSLRYWVSEMHIDGFRFDLGTILAREVYGFTEQSGFLKAVDQDPLLTTVKLIAEPWDIGPGGYQVGGFPPGWAEWNDKFRDTIRDFWRGDAPVSAVAPRLSASADMFNHQGRRAWASVNFVTAHDGFTLNDWASYNEKHNEANDEDNKDGNSNNASWNCGVEGPTDNKEVLALRGRQKRNMLATLLFAQGTPMLLGGDEFGRTQKGNNNAYCQDNEISWFNWKLDDDGRDLLAFTRRLIKVLQDCPILRRSRFLTGQHDPHLDVRDVTWINANGGEMQQKHWEDNAIKCFGMLLDGRAQKTGIRKLAEDETALIVLNGYEGVVDFTMPEAFGGAKWTLLIDTNMPDGSGDEDFPFGEVYQVTGRSLLLFSLKR
jgi:glycogen operon protein